MLLHTPSTGDASPAFLNGQQVTKQFLSHPALGELLTEEDQKIWTSTLQRTIISASPIVGFPKIQWRALNEISVVVCDGMTYKEIKKNMPEEYEERIFFYKGGRCNTRTSQEVTYPGTTLVQARLTAKF